MKWSRARSPLPLGGRHVAQRQLHELRVRTRGPGRREGRRGPHQVAGRLQPPALVQQGFGPLLGPRRRGQQRRKDQPAQRALHPRASSR
ncbi:MAG: hypothetical protein ABIO70_02120 [Pseudomonadota bacterium]